jgi:RNA polymerase sigma factor for flagellar operon FliA
MTTLERENKIRAFFPLVRRMAKRVVRIIPAASFEDLIGDGSIGLIRSVDTYEPARGFEFEHYACKVILGTMLNGLRRMDPIPERVRRRVRKAREESYRIAIERGSIPTMGEMERRPEGGEPLRYARTIFFRYTTLSLDAPLSLSERGLLDFAADPLSHAVTSSVREEVKQAIALLPERQRRVVMLHYYQKLSLHTIGAHLAVSPQRISQLHLRALEKLRMRIPKT